MLVRTNVKGCWAVGLICAAIGGTTGGYVGSHWDEWFHVTRGSGGESLSGIGESFFAMLLVGSVLGLVLGFKISLASDGWAQALRRSLGTSLTLCAIALGVAFLTGDIPPTLGGNQLSLLVELRYPSTTIIDRDYSSYQNRLVLTDLDRHGREGYREFGNLHLDAVRVEGDMRIAPARIFLYSAAKERRIHMELAEKEVTAFLVPLPAHPSKDNERWSDWADAGHGFLYRFRVERLARW